MDRTLRTEIVATVREAMREVTEENEEVWLSNRQLSEQFAFFSLTWLKRFGHLLPREQTCVCLEDGSAHRSVWAYPRNKIQRMIREGKFQKLRVES